MIGNEYGNNIEKDEETIRNEHEGREKLIMKQILKEKHLKHRKFVEELRKKEEEIKIKQENIPINTAYIDRRFHSAKLKAKVQNERMKNMLNKVDTYLKRVENMDSIELLRIQAEKEYQSEKSKNVGKDKMDQILTRLSKLNKKDEIEKEKNRTKIQERQKSKTKLLRMVRPSSSFKKDDSKIVSEKNLTINKNNLFKLNEDNLIGTNAIPNQRLNEEIEEGLEKIPMIQKFKRIKSANNFDTKSKNPKLKTLPFLNEKQNSEIELREIIKNGNSLKSLEKFKKKYKWFDVTPYIHKAQMELMKTKSIVRRGKPANKEYLENITKEAKEKINAENSGFNSSNILIDENSEISINKLSSNCGSYLNSCKFNNSDYIQLHLLSSRDDDEILDMINEKDEYNRKGIFYLIYHMNYTMIQLTLASGLILSDCIDKYKRNILHYCAMDEYSHIMEVICRCFIYEYKGDYEGMKKFLNKAFMNVKSEENHSTLMDEDCVKEMIVKMENNLINKIQIVDERNEIETHVVLKNNRNKISDNNIDTLNPTIITHNKNYFFEEINRLKLPLSHLINQVDVDGRTPLHFAAENNNIEIIKSLIYHNAKADIKDCNNKRPIDYATSDPVVKLLLPHTKLNKTKLSTEKTLILNTNNNEKSLGGEIKEDKILQIQNLKYLTDEKINKLTTGYENNSYLILSVLQDNFESFCYLLRNKNVDISFRNYNGWNVLHFIIANRRYKYLNYLFLTNWNSEDINRFDDLSEIKNSPKENDSNNLHEIERICDSISKREYSANDLHNTNGNLNTLANSFLAIDVLTNNQLNCLFMSINNKKESFILLKTICTLLIKREHLFQMGYFSKQKSNLVSSFEIVLNRKYDKTQQTLLLRAIECRNFEIIYYLLEVIKQEYSLINYLTSDKEKNNLAEKILVNFYESDKLGQNVLHYTVKYTKDPKFIKYFINLDADKNILRNMKDSNNKTAQDYDTSKRFLKYFTHTWDAAKLNDHVLLDKLIKEDSDTNINTQTPINKNTPLHIAALNFSDKACLYLISNKSDPDIKNSKKQTALDIATELAKSSDNLNAKIFLKKFKAILKKDITDYIQLENYGKNKSYIGNSFLLNSSMISVKNNSINKKVSEILNKIRTEIRERKLNIQKIFEIVDENKNGKIEGHEFESLFTILDIKGINRDDTLLMMSYIDTNKNGLIEYNEFIKALEIE